MLFLLSVVVHMYSRLCVFECLIVNVSVSGKGLNVYLCFVPTLMGRENKICLSYHSDFK